MIVAGFTGQLRGWWDNYLTLEERAMVINATASDEGVDNLGMALVANREDAVYTLILTILEHFNESDYYYSESESKAEIDLLDLSDSDKNIDNTCTTYKGMMQIITAHKWYIKCTILIDNSFAITNIVMIDSGADVSCIQEDPVTRDINALIDMKQKHIDSLQLELFSMNIFDTLNSTKVQEKIKLISENIAIDICAEHPSAFWNRKKYIVTLPYEDNFSEDDIPTKSRPCQMNAELVEFCKKEIDNLLQKGLIKPSKSPWSCTAFYVNNAAEKERGWNPPGVGEEVEVGEDHLHSPEEDHHLQDRHTDPHQTPQLYKWEENV
ncbi:uncharacterized protein [Nicotiana tomentosiformis]|uniref:uncharacterized protein n=1 Tax=Nicotiana tomentosiformis TaxID=4098 RepID=UPI00388C7E43